MKYDFFCKIDNGPIGRYLAIHPSQIESAPYSASNKLKKTCLTNQRAGFRMRPGYVTGIMNHYWTVVTTYNEVSWR